MAINQKQVLSLQQKLSPQQIQMIKLLELPAVQLEQRIKQEIEDNIVLEEEERSAEDEEQPPQQISFDEYLREDDTPSYKSRINNFSKDDKQRPVYLTEGRSLQEYLVEQLGYRNLPERDLRLAVYLIGSIDEDGYLRRDLESVADDIAFTMGLETTAGELERLLGIIHELEPAGIGARDLRECLLLQMAQMPVNTRPRRLARKILTSYFDEFVKKHYEKLMARLQISEDDFRDAIAEIRHLSPKPGNLYAEGGTDTTPYIIPDFILDYQDGRFNLSLNSYNVPEVRVNRRYMEMIREMVGSDGRVREKDKEAIQFVKNKIDSAKWFISAIKQRHDTLMRTMQTILDYQQEYFKDGDKSKLRLGAAHRPDRHLRRRIDAHRDIVADELSGKGVTHDMLLSRDVGVHVTESALHDQSAAVAAESLPGEAFAAGETQYDALAADKGGEFRKFGLRYVAVEIHGCKDNPSIWENQTKASNMLCLAAFALLWIAGPGRYAAGSRIARRLCTRPPESHSHAVGTPPRRQTPLRWPGFCRPERKTTPSWLRKPKLPTGSPSKNAANFPHRRSESPKRANSRSSTQRTSARRKPISVTRPTTGKPPWRAAFSPAPAKWASTSAAV